MGLVKHTVSASRTDAEGDRPAGARPGDTSSRDIATLTVMLEEGDAEARRSAAMELGGEADGVAVLGRSLTVESDQVVRAAIITSLILGPGAAACSVLRDGLRSENAAMRNECVEALRSLPEHCSTFVPMLLADPDSDVRILAINILESLAHPSVEAWLVDVILNDDHVNVCAAALNALSEVGTEHSADAIKSVLNRFQEDPFIVFSAELVLARVLGEGI